MHLHYIHPSDRDYPHSTRPPPSRLAVSYAGALDAEIQRLNAVFQRAVDNASQSSPGCVPPSAGTVPAHVSYTPSPGFTSLWRHGRPSEGHTLLKDAGPDFSRAGASPASRRRQPIVDPPVTFQLVWNPECPQCQAEGPPSPPRLPTPKESPPRLPKESSPRIPTPKGSPKPPPPRGTRAESLPTNTLPASCRHMTCHGTHPTVESPLVPILSGTASQRHRRLSSPASAWRHTQHSWPSQPKTHDYSPTFLATARRFSSQGSIKDATTAAAPTSLDALRRTPLVRHASSQWSAPPSRRSSSFVPLDSAASPITEGSAVYSTLTETPEHHAAQPDPSVDLHRFNLEGSWADSIPASQVGESPKFPESAPSVSGRRCSEREATPPTRPSSTPPAPLLPPPEGSSEDLLSPLAPSTSSAQIPTPPSEAEPEPAPVPGPEPEPQQELEPELEPEPEPEQEPELHSESKPPENHPTPSFQQTAETCPISELSEGPSHPSPFPFQSQPTSPRPALPKAQPAPATPKATPPLPPQPPTLPQVDPSDEEDVEDEAQPGNPPPEESEDEAQLSKRIQNLLMQYRRNFSHSLLDSDASVAVPNMNGLPDEGIMSAKIRDLFMQHRTEPVIVEAIRPMPSRRGRTATQRQRSSSVPVRDSSPSVCPRFAGNLTQSDKAVVATLMEVEDLLRTAETSYLKCHRTYRSCATGRWPEASRQAWYSNTPGVPGVMKGLQQLQQKLQRERAKLADLRRKGPPRSSPSAANVTAVNTSGAPMQREPPANRHRVPCHPPPAALAGRSHSAPPRPNETSPSIGGRQRKKSSHRSPQKAALKLTQSSVTTGAMSSQLHVRPHLHPHSQRNSPLRSQPQSASLPPSPHPQPPPDTAGPGPPVQATTTALPVHQGQMPPTASVHDLLPPTPPNAPMPPVPAPSHTLKPSVSIPSTTPQPLHTRPSSAHVAPGLPHSKPSTVQSPAMAHSLPLSFEQQQQQLQQQTLKDTVQKLALDFFIQQTLSQVEQTANITQGRHLDITADVPPSPFQPSTSSLQGELSSSLPHQRRAPPSPMAPTLLYPLPRHRPVYAWHRSPAAAPHAFRGPTTTQTPEEPLPASHTTSSASSGTGSSMWSASASAAPPVASQATTTVAAATPGPVPPISLEALHAALRLQIQPATSSGGGGRPPAAMDLRLGAVDQPTSSSQLCQMSPPSPAPNSGKDPCRASSSSSGDSEIPSAPPSHNDISPLPRAPEVTYSPATDSYQHAVLSSIRLHQSDIFHRMEGLPRHGDP